MNDRKEEINKIIFSNTMDEDVDFIPLISDEDEDSIKQSTTPDSVAILPLRNTVLFPGVILPITVAREKSIKLIRDAYASTKIVGAVAQIDPNKDEPKYSDLYKIGTIAQIVKILEMPDGSTTVIIQGRKRFELNDIVNENPYLVARISQMEDIRPEKSEKEFEAIVSSVKDLSLKIIRLSTNQPQEAAFAVKNIESSTFMINFVCSNSTIKLEDKQKLLEQNLLKQRGISLIEHLNKEIQMLELKNDIQLKVKHELDQQQREYLLHQQMKTIQNELGGNPVDQEIESMKKRAKKKKWSKQVAKTFDKEVDKLSRLNTASGEYSVQLNYLEVLLELPWNEYTKDNFDLKHAQKVLDEDHFGLEKVKERILEHLAVLKLKKDLKSPILCLIGPPGVGKTSLGKSVARALSRKYARMSLGGLHDEAEIRGHRKTYIGAMPGRILQGLKKAHSANPVFVLDEIDKVGNDFRGDPAAALLEVLDPEQNNAFYDNYIELEFDLSKVLFIATANTLSTVSPPLRDRMEVIDVSGYIVEEKVEIAKRHLIPKLLSENGVKKNQVEFSEKVIEFIVENHTHESGVRELDKMIAKIIRHTARNIAFGEKYNKKIAPADIQKILGSPKYLKDKYQGNEFAGVVTGLAWTASGGEILFVETSLSGGKGTLTVTGNLGDVMKESAVIAMQYFKAHCSAFGIKPSVVDKWNVHVHVPEGAIPKDGPSAGITMATSIVSAFTQRKVKKGLAMTGEITLRGKVLPVGGIKEKILAAKRAGISDLILSEENKKDIEEINKIYIKDLTFHYVKNIMDVLKLALMDEKVKNPVKIV
jgi:ATP-dependent Lon protease